MDKERRSFLIGMSASSAASFGLISAALQAQNPPGLSKAKVSKAKDVDLGPTPFQLSEYLPIEPVQVQKVKTSTAVGGESEVFWTSLLEAQRRSLLPNQDAVVRTQKVDIAGGASFLVSNFAASKGKYRVTVDYCRFRDENVLNGATLIGRGKVGIGLRVIATVDTFKTNLNLSGLIPLAINLNTQSITGSLEVKVIGIVNSKVSNLVPLPSTLDETSITKALEAIGAIKVLVDDDGTTSVPQLLAVSRQNISNPTPIINSIATKP